jgi:hypothetical protein
LRLLIRRLGLCVQRLEAELSDLYLLFVCTHCQWESKEWVAYCPQEQCTYRFRKEKQNFSLLRPPIFR